MEYQKIILTALVLQLIVALGSVSCLSGCKAQDSQRELRLSDFDFLELGMSLEGITDRLGEPDREVGSGLYGFQYDLVDGRVVTLSFITLDQLVGAWIVNEDGTRTDFFEKRD